MQGRLSAFVSGTLGAATLLLAAGCGGGAEGAAAPVSEVANDVVRVEVLVAAASGAANTVRASGLSAYRRETALSFGAPGEVESLRVDVGDRVAAGQVLATLRRTAVGADAEEAEVARRTAEQQLERVQQLFESGFASEAALDNARLAVQRARDTANITAPASGVILRRDAERGQVVGAGQALLWLGETASGVVVRASVTGADAARVTVGDPAEVTVRGGAPLTGSVLRIAPRSVEGTGGFEIEIRLEDAGGLRSGEVAEATIQTRRASQVRERYVVPALALTDARADQGVVFVVDAETKARRRAVSTGGVTDEGVIILDGVEPGDRIITRGASMVRDGDPVIIVNP